MEALEHNVDNLPTPDKVKNGCFIVGKNDGGNRVFRYYHDGVPMRTDYGIERSDITSLFEEIDELCGMVNKPLNYS